MIAAIPRLRASPERVVVRDVRPESLLHDAQPADGITEPQEDAAEERPAVRDLERRAGPAECRQVLVLELARPLVVAGVEHGEDEALARADIAVVVARRLEQRERLLLVLAPAPGGRP